MEIIVNDTKLSIFEGARVIDVVEMYFANQETSFEKEKISILDEQNHPVSFKGEMNSGDKLKIISK